MRKTCLEMVHKLALDDDRIWFVGSDLGTGTMAEFQKEMPERFVMEGISEQNVIGLAAGLAFEGKIVYVNTISTFLTRRCFEQVVLDLCLHNLKVRLIGNGGGMVYAPLGPTHMAIEDLAIFRAIPNMTIISVADAEEMKRMMPQTVDHPGPVYIRLAKGYDPVVTNPEHTFQIGRSIPMREGRDALIITTGVCLGTAIEAAKILQINDISTGILHMPTVKPLDEEAIIKRLNGIKAIITLEEHTITGGLGSAVAELLVESGSSGHIRFKRLGIPDIFPDRYGSQKELMTHYGLDAESAADTVMKLITG